MTEKSLNNFLGYALAFNNTLWWIYFNTFINTNLPFSLSNILLVLILLFFRFFTNWMIKNIVTSLLHFKFFYCTISPGMMKNICKKKNNILFVEQKNCWSLNGKIICEVIWNFFFFLYLSLPLDACKIQISDRFSLLSIPSDLSISLGIYPTRSLYSVSDSLRVSSRVR